MTESNTVRTADGVDLAIGDTYFRANVCGSGEYAIHEQRVEHWRGRGAYMFNPKHCFADRANAVKDCLDAIESQIDWMVRQREKLTMQLVVLA